MARAAIVSAGWYGFKPEVGELSFREMMFEAAMRAYSRAGVDPRRDVDAFFSCQEDYWEGIAITDEFAPEPIGGVLRPTSTVAGDFIQCLGQAVMLVRTGYFDLVAVEAHAKPSDIATMKGVLDMALDPLYLRPLNPPNPHFLGGLMANAFLARTGVGRETLAMVAAKNKNAGLSNPRAGHAAPVTVGDVLSAKPVVDPLTWYDIAPFSDAAIVMLVASEEAARRHTDTPVWIEGVGWSTESGTGSLAWHQWDAMPSIRMAVDMAKAMAGLSGKPQTFTSFAELEDRYSFMEILSMEEAGIASAEEAYSMLEAGDTEPTGSYPVNPSGGSLAAGVALEATGGCRVLEAYERLLSMGEEIEPGRERALVVSWRGPPTRTAMAVILGV
ncbi:thiolase domain-containing protein [Aeropyrum camini]|uniref:Acetyl-CoA acetyltransferase n=1 Tax=Aeropyrum camini SY1 = JCM 12091 TaxID=1198449 RepID=U3TFZ9_9CREN|nr:thiolase domain-containing protein [Aeropyrum camini]BAN90965.1 acetyl-CoA acetyltransferase [Aeropyrum camini SY1 = JCM 12091]